MFNIWTEKFTSFSINPRSMNSLFKKCNIKEKNSKNDISKIQESNGSNGSENHITKNFEKN